MWDLWQQATKYSKLPSEIFGEEDSIAAWMLNTAVTWFGITIENLLSERVEVMVGKGTKSYPKYTLTRLLHADYRVTRTPEAISTNPWTPFLAWIGKKDGLVKRYVYKPPEETVD